MPAIRLSILGLGLLGGSTGLALKRGATEYRITGYDTNADAVRTALEMNAIDVAATMLSDAVCDADVVILAVPVISAMALLRSISPQLKRDAIVTDVGSTKRSIVKIGEDLIGGRFIGSHPMAGGERSGIAAARADLFDAATCILTPTEVTQNDALSTVNLLWKSLGMTTCVLSADDHDRLIASASHLPHALAAMLLKSLSDESIALSGKGLADTTRIAAGDANLWQQIFLDNADNLREALGKFRTELDRFELLLDPKQPDALRAYLEFSAARRRGMR